MSTTMVVGVGGRGHRDWAIGPRVISRLAADPLVRSLGVQLMVAPELPARLLNAGRDVHKLIIVRVTPEGGPRGRIHQEVLDMPTGRRPHKGAVSPGCRSGLGAVTGALALPRRVVVFSVEGCDLMVGRASTPETDEAVRRIVAMAMRELGSGSPRSGPSTLCLPTKPRESRTMRPPQASPSRSRAASPP